MGYEKRYQYARLPLSPSTRVIHLLPGRANEPLRCSIEVVPNIASTSAYECISYVWGEWKDLQELEIIHGGHVVGALEITPSLAGALRQFRDASVSRRIWADSVCINQEDIDERNVQVPRMGQIYSNADAVLIWLGEDDAANSAKIAVECMKRLVGGLFYFAKVNGFGDNDIAYLNSGMTESALNELGFPPRDSPEFNALRTLFRKAWFYRAWTWQESFLAKKRIYYWGDQLWRGFLLDRTLRMLSLAPLGSAAGKILEEGSSRLATMLQNKNSWPVNDRDNARMFSLMTVLAVRRGSGCKFPSDLVYSLAGAGLDGPAIEVDYKKPFETVYTTLAAKLIHYEGQLSILGLAGIQPELGASTLPSWVPDWRKNGSTGLGNPLAQKYFAATGSSKPAVQFFNDGSVLSVRGLQVDQIVWTLEIEKSNPFEDVANMINSNTRWIQRYSAPRESLYVSIWRTLAHDLTHWDTTQPFGSISRWSLEQWNRFHSIADASRERYNELKMEAFRSMKNANYDNVIFITSDGRLGIAPRSICQGDAVTLLLGSRLPTVLRPLGEGRFKLVSESYVHGLMDGEGLIMAREAADPRFNSADSSWLGKLDALQAHLLPFSTQQFYIY